MKEGRRYHRSTGLYSRSINCCAGLVVRALSASERGGKEAVEREWEGRGKRFGLGFEVSCVVYRDRSARWNALCLRRLPDGSSLSFQLIDGLYDDPAQALGDLLSSFDEKAWPGIVASARLGLGDEEEDRVTYRSGL